MFEMHRRVQSHGHVFTHIFCQCLPFPSNSRAPSPFLIHSTQRTAHDASSTSCSACAGCDARHVAAPLPAVDAAQ